MCKSCIRPAPQHFIRQIHDGGLLCLSVALQNNVRLFRSLLLPLNDRQNTIRVGKRNCIETNHG